MYCFDRRFIGFRVISINPMETPDKTRCITVKWISKYSSGFFRYKVTKDYFLTPVTKQMYLYRDSDSLVPHHIFFTEKEIKYISNKIIKKINKLVRM